MTYRSLRSIKQTTSFSRTQTLTILAETPDPKSSFTFIEKA